MSALMARAPYRYLVLIHGQFLTPGGRLSGEYPEARIFTHLQAARRTVDCLKPPVAHFEIHEVEAYIQGRPPKVRE